MFVGLGGEVSNERPDASLNIVSVLIGTMMDRFELTWFHPIQNVSTSEKQWCISWTVLCK